jgi:hypothetical protein
MVCRDVCRRISRRLLTIQIAPPRCQVSAQPIEIDIGKRVLGAVQIAQGPLQNRASTHIVAGRFMMKGDCQLNHSLKMPPRRLAARHGAPDVLKNFVSVKEVSAIKKIEALAEVRAEFRTVMIGPHRHLVSAEMAQACRAW